MTFSKFDPTAQWILHCIGTVQRTVQVEGKQYPVLQSFVVSIVFKI